MSEEKKNKEVGEMIHDYLQSNNYDGLYNPGSCACESIDLMPCGNVEISCMAGYKIAGDELKCKCSFHISKTKDSTDYECEL